MTTTFYRYEDCHGAVLLEEYRVARETPCGVWLHVPYGKRREKFVKLHEYAWQGKQAPTRKRWACPTEAEARESFLARKRRQLSILKFQIETTELAISNAEAGLFGYAHQHCQVFEL